MIDTRELKRLSPEERIKHLQELEVEKRKDIQILQKLLAQALNDLDEKLSKQQIPIPQVESVDVSNLVSEEEREMFRLKQFQSGSRKDNLNVSPVISSDVAIDAKKTGKPTVPERGETLEESVAAAPRIKGSSAQYQHILSGRPIQYASENPTLMENVLHGTQSYHSAEDSMIKNIVELTDLFYQQTNRPESFGQREWAKFYKIKEESEKTKIHDVESMDENIRKKIGIVEKLINMVQYNI